MEPNWGLSAPDWPHVGPMNLVIRVSVVIYRFFPLINSADMAGFHDSNFDLILVTRPPVKYSKPFWCLIRYMKFDIVCISPIRHAGQLLKKSIVKAGMFGTEFQSVSIREDLTCVPCLGCKRASSIIPPLTITKVGVNKLLDWLYSQTPQALTILYF